MGKKSEPILPGEGGHRGGGRPRRKERALPPKFESWGFSPRHLYMAELVIRALKSDCEREKMELEEEISKVEDRIEELRSQLRID